MKKCTPEKLANKWIREMQKANFTPDQMLECLKLAREKNEAIVESQQKLNSFLERLSKIKITKEEKLKAERFKDFHKIATSIFLSVPPGIQSLIDAKRAQEKKEFEKTLQNVNNVISTGNGFISKILPSTSNLDSFPSGGIQNDFSNNPLHYIQDFGNFKHQNILLFHPYLNVDSFSDAIGKFFFTKKYFVKVTGDVLVENLMNMDWITFWERFANFAMKDLIREQNNFIFWKIQTDIKYSKTRDLYVFKNTKLEGLFFTVYNPQLTGVNETRPFSAKELLQMQHSKIYAYSSMKH